MLSFALYGLIMFYGLTHEELQGRRPLAKFLSIKLIVMLTFYQSFVVSHILLNLYISFSDDVCSISSPHWREKLFMVRFLSLLIMMCRGFIKAIVIGTQFWTATNIADGLTALTVCIEVWHSD